jgi:hypothetical protein
MLEVAIMIEGQDGLDWPRWQRLARAVEDLGYAGLFRSDHFTNPTGPVLDALELWSSLTWLADNTSRIEFGPLVSPVSFRHPVITAWTAAAGVGLWRVNRQGWQQYSCPKLSVGAKLVAQRKFPVYCNRRLEDI